MRGGETRRVGMKHAGKRGRLCSSEAANLRPPLLLVIFHIGFAIPVCSQLCKLTGFFRLFAGCGRESLDFLAQRRRLDRSVKKLHTVAIRRDQLAQQPELSQSIYKGFCDAKKAVQDEYKHRLIFNSMGRMFPPGSASRSRKTSRPGRGLVALRHGGEPEGPRGGVALCSSLSQEQGDRPALHRRGDLCARVPHDARRPPRC